MGKFSSRGSPLSRYSAATKCAFPSRMKEFASFEKARCAGMIERGTRPKHAELLIHLFVSDAVIIRDAAARSLTQLIEDLARAGIRKELFLTQTSRQLAVDPGIGTRISRRIHGLRDMNHAAFQVARHAFLFFLHTARQH